MRFEPEDLFNSPSFLGLGYSSVPLPFLIPKPVIFHAELKTHTNTELPSLAAFCGIPSPKVFYASSHKPKR